MVATGTVPGERDGYDAILLVSFGGPEKMEDVLPFLENVLRGRNVPRERMLEVAHHYELFGGVSPINAQCRELLAELKLELAAQGISLPIYWGNRNWQPYLADTLRAMAEAGVRRALAFVTAAYSSYSSCRQYRENIAQAQTTVGPTAPQVDELRVFYNHPRFVAANVDGVRGALQQLPVEGRAGARLAFTAHSIPSSMANQSQYVSQLRETCRLVADELHWPADQWNLVYQSRSGRPQDPWLEPDICDHLRQLPAQGVTDVVVHPVGFLSDHLEVLYDLDVEARQVCDEVGLRMARGSTVGTHPLFVRMIRELIEERLSPGSVRAACGGEPASHDVCPVDCCPAPMRPPAPGQPTGRPA